MSTERPSPGPDDPPAYESHGSEIAEALKAAQATASSQSPPEQAPRDTRVTLRYTDDEGHLGARQAPDNIGRVLARQAEHNSALARELAPPSREVGVNMDRVDRYIEAKGLYAAPALLLTRSEIATFRDRLASAAFRSSALDELAEPEIEGGRIVVGEYIAELGMVIVAIDASIPDMDESIRAAYLEAFVVHEKAHGSSHISNDLTYEPEQFARRARSGFATNKVQPGESPSIEQASVGSFFEEAFAEFVTGEYVRDELGLPRGFWGDEGVPVHKGDPELLSKIRGVYLWPQTDGGFNYGSAAIAATGMELLIDLRPELYQAVYHSRNSVNGLRQVARVVNSIEPGLYERLRQLEYSQADFFTGLSEVLRAREEYLARSNNHG